MFLIAILLRLCFSSPKYAIMVDCGSSHTHVYLYSWEPTEDIPIITNPNPKEQTNFELDIKLSSAATNNSIIKIIGNAIIDRCSRFIPAKKLSSTNVFVYATAGLRLLPEYTQKSIMKKMYQYLREHSQFRVKQNMIKVISGAEEGVFGWLTINYLLGQLEPQKNTSIAFDMGGASTEIAFELQNEGQMENSYSIRVGRRTVNIFSYSYLYYGSDTANSAVNDYFFNQANSSQKNFDPNAIPNPCYFMNYTKKYTEDYSFNGTGNFALCSECIQKVLLQKPNFTDVLIPSLDAIKNVHAISTFAYVRIFLNLSSHLTLAEMKNAFGQLSSLTMDQIYEKYKDSVISKKFLPGYFWQTSYVLTFLEQGMNLTDALHTYDMPSIIDGNDISWALGAMVKEVYDIQIRDKSKPYLSTLLIINTVLFVLAIVVFAIYVRINYKKNEPDAFIPLIPV